jgi:hypothetical protein
MAADRATLTVPRILVNPVASLYDRTMRLPASLAIFVSLIAPSAFAASPGCPESREAPDVQVQIVHGEVSYDFGLDSSRITDLARRTGSHHAGDGQVARGLTVKRLVWRVRNLEVSRVRGTGGEVCSSPVRAVVEVGYEPGMTVYVQSSYGEGSCQREAILLHERGHVAINDAVLVAHAEAIREAAFAAMSAPSFPVATEDRDTGPRIALEAVSRAVGGAVAAMERDLAARNGEHDLPASLDDTTRACRDW